jgi:flagellar export protein FliJ
MRQFIFRLQRLLEQRAEQEKRLAVALSSALDRASEARDAQETLDEVRRASREQLVAAHSGNVTAGQLQNIGFLLEQLDEYVAMASVESQQAESKAEEAREELIIAHQAKATLDRLRERRHVEWIRTDTMLDQRALDEFALSRFTLNASPLGAAR